MRPRRILAADGVQPPDGFGIVTALVRLERPLERRGVSIG
jgi:hypothetical protein